MLRSRIIPCLLIRNKGLVKTVNFKDGKYVGDPINAVRIFNEKEVDELVVFDIDATVQNRDPDYKMIENLAKECRMPLCYGGGIKDVEQAIRISNLGVEKVAISSQAVINPSVVSDIIEAIGSQSVVVVVDVKKSVFGKYEVYIQNGTQKVRKKLPDLLKEFDALKVGEVIVNSIDMDGKMSGYDEKLIQIARDVMSSQLSVLGGAGSLEHIKRLISKYKIIGACAGSLFVFKGVYKAVLINYPAPSEKMDLASDSIGIN